MNIKYKIFNFAKSLNNKSFSQIINKQLHKDKQQQLIEIAEMKPDIYFFLKGVRIITFYGAVPYFLISNFITSIKDNFLHHFFISAFAMFIPYLLTENFVVKLKYDPTLNELLITKLNLFCKENTMKYEAKELFKIKKQYSLLRIFTSFKHKKLNEIFSMEKICILKEKELYDQLITEKKIVSKKERNQRLIDIKLNKSQVIMSWAKKLIIGYAVIIPAIIYFQYRSAKRKSEIVID